MKKSIFKFLLVLFALFIGVNKVSAYELSYKTYKAGDEIEVVLNGQLSEKFYVLEDTEYEVIAIYKDVLGEMFWFNPTTKGLKGSEAEKRLNDLTKDWDFADEITLLDATQIKKDIKIEEQENYEFSEPKYLHIGKSYWTKTVIDDGGNYYPYVVTNWGTISNLHTTQAEAPASGGYIRPVIKIDKYWIKNAMVRPKTFEELVDGFEKIIDEDYNIETKILEDGLVVKFTDNDEKKDITFKYDGQRISFEDKDGKEEIDDEFVEYIISLIETDYLYDEEYEKTDYEITGKYYRIKVIDTGCISEFSFDLEHYFGFSNKKGTDTSAKDDKVENPKTADTNVAFLIGGLTLCIGLIALSKKRICKSK